MLDGYPVLQELLLNNWVQAGLFVVGGGIVAWLVQTLFRSVFLRLVRRTTSDLDDNIVRVLKKPVFYILWLIAIGMALGALEIPEPYIFWLRSILKMIVFILGLVAAGRVVRMVLHSGSRNERRLNWLDEGSLPLFDNLLKIVLICTGVYLLLSAWNVNVKPLLASAGIAGIAIGFAAKDTLANLFGGIFILADAPYKIGDYIVLDGGQRGCVTHIGLRSTRILTRDDVEVTIPNAMIANSTIVNESGGPSPKFRVALNVGVSYGSDIDQVTAILMEVAREVQEVADDPEPRIRFTRFGDSSLDFSLLCWVEDPAIRGLCLHQLHTLTFRKFKQHGVEIPFPQRVMHMPGKETGSGESC
jgi:small-conductance mechanosensitive channel